MAGFNDGIIRYFDTKDIKEIGISNFNASNSTLYNEITHIKILNNYPNFIVANTLG